MPKTDLVPFSANNVNKSIIYPGLVVGISCGLVIYLLDITVFKSSSLSGGHPPLWAGLLASLYGGLNEEVLLRLFFFTLVYFLFKKGFQFKTKNRTYFLWLSNLIVAILFGIGHLPAAFKMTTPSSFEIFRVLLLNGIPGIAFGWLYWTRGLWAAIAAHFTTDLMIHVLLI